MPTHSPAPRSGKTSEFAHLFELFDKLARGRSAAPVLGRASNEGESSLIDDTCSVPIRTDLEPVIRDLVTLVGPRIRSREDMREEKLGNKPRVRERSKTIAVAPDLGPDNFKSDDATMGSDTTEDDDSESRLKFGLGKSRPFTFKMMLHKLYELDEWGRKVKEVLEKSQNEFKPLAENKEIPKRARAKTVVDARSRTGTSVDVKETSQVHFSAASQDRSPIKSCGRPRSHTVSSTTGGRGRESGYPAILIDNHKSQDSRHDLRTIKKRCIGRRKSATGLDVNGRAAWIYIGSPAAVALSENDRCSGEGLTTISVPKPLKYGALQDGPRLPRKIINRRRVSSVDSTPTDAVVGNDEVATRRRVMSVTTSSV
ncbi:hypothetical protein VKT23_005040 [Stygiomarasmius scandens]|uniref:Uncharacterized protein n=1 Tax=Marasmiellus scandens TaxID=2682957 RepID=A0ABR1JRY6_9AGAR